VLSDRQTFAGRIAANIKIILSWKFYFSVLFSSFCSADCFSSVSPVSSSIGFGGGVVAIVHPIHAPMARMARKPTNTGMATIQKRRPSKIGRKSPTAYRMAIIMQAVNRIWLLNEAGTETLSKNMFQ